MAHTCWWECTDHLPLYDSNVAERSLALAIMRILWAFKIQPSSSAKLPLNSLDFPSFMPGQAGEDMPVTLVPRDQKRVTIIRESMQKAENARVPMVGVLVTCIRLPLTRNSTLCDYA